MSPAFKFYQYRCAKCNIEREEMVSSANTIVKCKKCKKKMIYIPMFGGYQMSGEGSSTRPRHAGSFLRKKIK